MSEDIKQHVDTSSTEFKKGLVAGLNPTDDTKNWQSGIELGQALRDEGENTQPVAESVLKESSAPVLIGDSQGNNGSEQDEKDETEE